MFVFLWYFFLNPWAGFYNPDIPQYPPSHLQNYFTFVISRNVLVTFYWLRKKITFFFLFRPRFSSCFWTKWLPSRFLKRRKTMTTTTMRMTTTPRPTKTSKNISKERASAKLSNFLQCSTLSRKITDRKRLMTTTTSRTRMQGLSIYISVDLICVDLFFYWSYGFPSSISSVDLIFVDLLFLKKKLFCRSTKIRKIRSSTYLFFFRDEIIISQPDQFLMTAAFNKVFKNVLETFRVIYIS